MKNKILTISFALIAIAGLTALTGCKKGENDPFLSLKSRKARISGEWKLSSGTVTESYTSGGTTTTDVTTYIGSSMTYNGVPVSYTEKLTIEKDGTFETVIVEDGVSYTVRGNWFFSGKSKDAELKNKEAIIFSETQYISTTSTSLYTGLYGDRLILIDQLKNKELIFSGSISYNELNGNSATYSYDRTFEKQ